MDNIFEFKDEYLEYYIICNRVCRNLGVVVLFTVIMHEIFAIATPVKNSN